MDKVNQCMVNEATQLNEFIKQLEPEKNVVLIINNQSVDKSSLGSSIKTIFGETCTAIGTKVIFISAVSIGCVLLAGKLGVLLNKDIDDLGIRTNQVNKDSIKFMTKKIKGNLKSAISDFDNSLNIVQEKSHDLHKNMRKFSTDQARKYAYLTDMLDAHGETLQACDGDIKKIAEYQKHSVFAFNKEKQRRKELLDNASKLIEELVQSNKCADNILKSLCHTQSRLENATTINSDSLQLLMATQPYSDSNKRPRSGI